jgi:hypothetical protein
VTEESRKCSKSYFAAARGPSLGLVPRKPRAYTEGLFHFAARGSDLRYLFSSDEDRETFTSKAPSQGPFE